MSGINVQISTTNLTQVDRHQSDTHRLPITHQEQNAVIAQNSAHSRVTMPVEPDSIDKKNINVKDRKKDSEKKEKKRKYKEVTKKHGPPLRDPDHFIDLHV